MRVVSLLPGATEILFAIGTGEQVVGRTHECDFPGSAQVVPVVTIDLLPVGLTAAAIDGAERESFRDEHTFYEVDGTLLAELKPQVVIAQSNCSGCRSGAGRDCTMPRMTRVIASDPTSLAEVFDSIVAIGTAVGAGADSRALVSRLKSRMAAVGLAVGGRSRPRVAILEWPDPIYAGGRWLPEMVALAGGVPLLGSPGLPMQQVTVEDIIGAAPDVIVLSFRGFTLREAQVRYRELSAHQGWRQASTASRVIALDSAYLSRSGPRLVDGVELLAWSLHRLETFVPPVGRGAQLIEAGWVDLAAFPAWETAPL